MVNPKDTDRTYKMALSMLKGVTVNVLDTLGKQGMSLREFFHCNQSTLCMSLGVGMAGLADERAREEALIMARKEEEFIDRHSIDALFITDPEYPQRLVGCADAPMVLYRLGKCDLNSPHQLSVVGTRRITPYGQEMCRRIVGDCGDLYPDLSIVSGLAYGADAVAHTTAVERGLKTIAVVAHGLNTIYPAAHRDLAKRIVQSGGAILTEYPSGTTAYRQHFLARNRIVAWLADATLIIESQLKGGAMSTANYARQEDRKLLALPGRASDGMSEGCNHLIRRGKATLVTSASEVAETIGWQVSARKIATPVISGLFPEPEGDEKRIYDFVKGATSPISVDEIQTGLGLPMSVLLGSLSEMEFDGMLLRHPGNRFSALS